MNQVGACILPDELATLTRNEHTVNHVCITRELLVRFEPQEPEREVE